MIYSVLKLFVVICCLCFKDILKAFDDFKNSKKVCEVMSFDTWKFAYSLRIQYIIHWDKTQMLKKFSSIKIKGTKNALFFVSRTPTHHSFTFSLRLLYKLKYKVCLSKTVCGIFHFWFRFIFIKFHIFVQQSAWSLWL